MCDLPSLAADSQPLSSAATLRACVCRACNAFCGDHCGISHGAADLKTVASRERPKTHLCDGHHIALAATSISFIQREPGRAAPRLGTRHHPQRTLQWPPSKTK
jgi:hypothetical protein